MDGYVSLPWLKPADPTREFNEAYGQAASVAEANARLTEEQNRVAMEAQIHADTLKQQATLAQQKIANDQAYKQQEIGIRQAGLQNAAAAIAVKGKQAAQKLESQKRFNDLVASGVSPEQAMFQSGLGTPQIAEAYDRSRSNTSTAKMRADIEKQRLDQQNARGIETGSTRAVYPADTATGIQNTVTTRTRQPLIPPKTNLPSNASGQGASIPTISSQEDYDALPSGAVFIDAGDGKKKRKK